LEATPWEHFKRLFVPAGEKGGRTSSIILVWKKKTLRKRGSGCRDVCKLERGERRTGSKDRGAGEENRRLVVWRVLHEKEKN